MSVSPASLLLRLLPLAALGALLAQPAQARAAEPASGAPFLWQIDGAEAPSHLFGTIHAGVEARELPASVGQALDASRWCVLETVPDRSMLAHFEQTRAAQPMDLALGRRAHEHRLPVVGLESLAFQRHLLGRLSSAEDLAALMSSELDELEPLVAAYRSGSLERIRELTSEINPETRECLLLERNRRWVRQLTPALRRGGAFVAVGVGHTPGEDGLLELLHTRGYNLRRIE